MDPVKNNFLVKFTIRGKAHQMGVKTPLTKEEFEKAAKAKLAAKDFYGYKGKIENMVVEDRGDVAVPASAPSAVKLAAKGN